MTTGFMRDAVNALKQAFKDCGNWHEGPGFIGTKHLIIGGKQDEIDAIKVLAGLNTKQTSKVTISNSQELVDKLLKDAQDDSADILEEPGVSYVDKNGKTLRVLFGESVGVVFVNDKLIPNGNVASIFTTPSKKFLYIVPAGKIGMSEQPWMLVAAYVVEEKLATYFEALAKAIVKDI